MSYKHKIEENLSKIEESINRAVQRSGRSRGDISLMAVTKTHPLEAVEAAYEAGLRLFGENRVTEDLEKYSNIPEDLRLEMIGHLQRNKAKQAVEIFSAVQSIDKKETLGALNKYCLIKNKSIDILIEVNTSGELSKNGCAIDEVFPLIEDVLKFKSLNLCGFMTLGPLTSEEGEIRKAFKSLYSIYKKAGDRFPELNLKTLSMGMSGDFPIAIEEGSNLIRVGTLLFGSRNQL